MITDKPRREQYDRCGCPCGVCGAGDGDSTIGLLERGSVVDTIAGHAHDVAAALKNIDNVVLVFRKYLRESIGLFDGFLGLGRLLLLRVAQGAGIQNVSTQSELFRSLPGDGDLIASNHLDVHAHLPGARDGRFGLLARRIEQRQHAGKLPLAFLVGSGYA